MPISSQTIELPKNCTFSIRVKNILKLYITSNKIDRGSEEADSLWQNFQVSPKFIM